MSRAESFLRGGTPCTEVPELIEVLSSAGKAYTHWRFVAYYPQRWLHDAVENRTTAPLYFLVFAAAAAGGGSPTAPTSVSDAAADSASQSLVAAHDIDLSTWHLLCYTVLPNGAVPREVGDGGGGSAMDNAVESVTVGGGGVGALRTLLRTLPVGLHPSASLEWLSVMDGQAYERMGLISSAVFASTVAPAVAEVVGQCWKPQQSRARSANTNDEPSVAAAHYVHDSHCADTFDFVRQRTSSSSTSASAMLQLAKRAQPAAVMQHFVDEVVRAAVTWMASTTSMRAFTADASVPPLPEACRALLYSAVASLPRCLFTSLFVEATHADAGPCAPLADPATLTGLAKLRAERDAGIAQWKQKVGEYASFTLPATNADAADTTTRPFQHVILLQRPIEEKHRIDVDNRDPGPLAPQPIGAELHLLQDRGDVQYTLEQLGNRSNLHFLYTDTLPDDGEVLVQLVPVEGTPFADLEAFFASVPADASVLAAGPAAQCAGSCCDLVVPRVLFRRPTGKTEKANPIATAQAAVEVLSPSAEMVAAAVSALQFVETHVEALKSEIWPPSLEQPRPGYTLRVAPVDLSLVPAKKCGWCGRRREVLLRCGSCKTVLYCCKRHQVLDWKDGAHKVECRLWRHARELQERVVEKWKATTTSTWTATPEHAKAQDAAPQKADASKGKGWSCAATLVQFIRDVEAETARRGESASRATRGEAVKVHVAGFDPSCLDEFLQACAAHLSDEGVGVPPLSVHQYRILLCADTFSDDQRNAVWAVRRRPQAPSNESEITTDSNVNPTSNSRGGSEKHEGLLWRTAGTGVLGDTWHCQGCNEAATQPAACVALLRCCGVKYHNVDRSVRGGMSSPSEQPDAVLSFGPFSGEGCTYLSAALEVFAGHDIGVVPLRLVDSSYVGAVRTRDALAARLSSNDVCPPSRKSRASALIAQAKAKEGTEVAAELAQTYTLSGGPRQPFLILFNDTGAVAQEVAAKTGPSNGFEDPALQAEVEAQGAAAAAAAAAVAEAREERAGSAVPHYINSYVSTVYPADF